MISASSFNRFFTCPLTNQAKLMSYEYPNFQLQGSTEERIILNAGRT